MLTDKEMLELARVETYVSIRKLQDMAQKQIVDGCIYSIVADAYMDITYSLLNLKREKRKSAKQRTKILLDNVAKLERTPINRILLKKGEKDGR